MRFVRRLRTTSVVLAALVAVPIAGAGAALATGSAQSAASTAALEEHSCIPD